MEFVFSKFQNINQIIDFAIAILILIAMIYIALRLKVTKATLIILSALEVIYMLCWIFSFDMASYLVFGVLITITFVVCLLHSGAIRTRFAHFSKSQILKNGSKISKIIDHEKLYNEIYECVVSCSRQKIVALITLEKHDNLSNLTKNGTVVNAPVTHEL